MRRQHESAIRELGVWLGLAAVVVQVLLPFLVAVEIRVLARYPFLFATFDQASICGHAAAGQPGGGSSSGHRDIGACPLCTALAAAHAVTPATPPFLSPPRETVAIAVAAPAPAVPVSRYHGSYEARGPPAHA